MGWSRLILEVQRFVVLCCSGNELHLLHCRLHNTLFSSRVNLLRVLIGFTPISSVCIYIYNSPTLDVAADLSWVVVWWRQISTNIMGLTLVTHSISAPNGVPKSNIIRARRDDPTRQSPMSQLIMTIYSMILVAIFATYGHNQQIKW